MARLASRSCPIIIGRDDELTTGTRLLTEATNAQGQFVLISGEAGIGKSRLARAIGDVAVATGFQRLVGVCQEQDRAFPFAPLRDALRQQLRRTGTPGPARLFGADYPLFAHLLPELVRTDAAPMPPLPPEEERRRLFEAFARMFTRLARVAPLFIVLEDLHWADEASLALLQLLPRRLAETRVCAVLTARNDEPGDPLAHWQGYLTRNHLITTVDLAPLTRAHMTQVIIATMGTTVAVADRPTASVIAAIEDRAEGNPFFVEELLHAWAGTGVSGQLPNARFVPTGIRETVTHRLDALGDAVRAIAETAAVIGRHFSFATLRTVTGGHERTLTLALRALIAAYLVIEVEEGGEQGFAFRHALTREAIYARLLAVERKRLHRQVARVRAAEAEAGVPVPAGELGYHFHAAGEWKAALRWCRAAGDEAMALYAPHAAVEHFARAIEATDALGVVAMPLVAARGRAYRLISEIAHARRDYERALAEARHAGDDAAAMQVLIELGTLWSTNDLTRSRHCYEAAAALARTGEDAAAMAHILSYLGYLHLLADQPAVAEPYAQEALAIAQNRDNAHEMARAFQVLGVTAIDRADLVRAARYNRAAAAGFAAVHDSVGQASVLAHLSYESATLYTDWAMPAVVSLAVGVTDAAQALAVAQAGGSSLMEMVAHVALTVALGAQGVYGPALAHAHEAVQSAAAMENRQHGLLAHNALGLIYRDLLTLPRALSHLERALTLAREFGALNPLRDMAAHLISTLIEAGQITQAEALLRELFPPDMPTETLVQRHLSLTRAEFALATGEPNTALCIVNSLIATAINIGNLGDRGIPRLSLLRGKALTALGRTAEAEAALIAAAETAAAQGARPLLWRIHAALGLLHDAADDTTRAMAAFTTAQGIVTTLADTIPDTHMHLRTTFVRGVADMIPAHYRISARAAAKSRDDTLTRRERDVVMQVAQGVSNREIAAALFITEKTVEAHITHSLRKLSLRTRSNLITWAATTPAALAHPE